MGFSMDPCVVARRPVARAALAVLVVAMVASGLMHAKAAAAAGDPCPCGLLAGSAVPGTPNDPDLQAQQQGIELGVQFTSDVAGFVSAIRFYKGSGNVGLHLGDLWDASGNRVNTAAQARSFSGETASGWQTLTFPAPVPIAANTTYTAAYHSNYGSYSADDDFFDQPLDAAPLHSAGDGGVYAYGGVQPPTSTFNHANYWVDVVFDTHVTPYVAVASPGPNQTGISFQAQANSSGALQATFSEPMVASSVHMELQRPDGSAVPGFVSYQQLMPGPSGVFAPTGPLAPGTTYTLSVSQATDAAGFTMQPQSWTFTTATVCPCSLFPSSLAPAVPSSGDGSSVELGMTFGTGAPGQVLGIRFYKASDNTGTHVGELWSSSGLLLATATFTNETSSGWQQVAFPVPVHVNTTDFYVAAYHTDAGNYSATPDGFQVQRVNTVLPGTNTGMAGLSGSYAYGAAGTFPSQTYQGINYWVDVSFIPDAQVG